LRGAARARHLSYWLDFPSLRNSWRPESVSLELGTAFIALNCEFGAVWGRLEGWKTFKGHSFFLQDMKNVKLKEKKTN